jgi:hypothetical protein
MESKQRWYIPVLAVLAAVAVIWGISEQTTTRGKPAEFVAADRS